MSFKLLSVNEAAEWSKTVFNDQDSIVQSIINDEMNGEALFELLSEPDELVDFIPVRGTRLRFKVAVREYTPPIKPLVWSSVYSAKSKLIWPPVKPINNNAL